MRRRQFASTACLNAFLFIIISSIGPVLLLLPYQHYLRSYLYFTGPGRLLKQRRPRMMRIDLGRVRTDYADFVLYPWHSLSSPLATTITTITIVSSVGGWHYASAAFGFK